MLVELQGLAWRENIFLDTGGLLKLCHPLAGRSLIEDVAMSGQCLVGQGVADDLAISERDDAVAPVGYLWFVSDYDDGAALAS